MTVKVTADDGYGGSVSDTFDIVVRTEANSAPTVANAIANQPATVGTAFDFTFAENTFNDANSGDTLTYTATQDDGTALPDWLSFAAGTRTFSGTPQTADVGTVTVKVTANDGTDSVSDTFDIVVRINRAPTASDIAKTVNEDATLTFAATDFTAAFSDPDNHTLKSVRIVTLPNSAHGVLKAGESPAAVSAGDSVASADLGTIKFEPVADWNGDASFTYKVTDSDDAESAAAATVSITVSAVDDDPTASDFSKTVSKNTTLTFAAADFTGAFGDADGHTLKSVRIVTLPTSTHGTLKAGDPLAALSAGNSVAAADLGTIKFEPVADWRGSASFTYKVTDSSDAESAAAATVSITVNALPTASGISKTVAEDTTLTFAAADFTGAFSDEDGHTLKSVTIVTLPDAGHGVLKAGDSLAAVSAGGSVAADDLGTITFEPVADWNGSASFTYKVTDSSDAESAAAATVSITVSAVDDDPSAGDFSKTVDEDTTLTFAAADFTGAFSDADEHTLKSVTIVTLPDAGHGVLKADDPPAAVSAGGSVAADDLSTITFEPVANWNGSASFTYKVTDSSDAESAAAATVSITVSAVDDAPTASGISKTVNEDTTLTFAAADFTGAFSDADGHTLKSVTIVTLPDSAHGVLKAGDPLAAVSAGDSVTAANLGTIKFEPVADWNGSASFTYQVTDSSDAESAAAATVSITVNAVDDAPTASDISKTVDEDTTLTFAAADFTGAFSDADGHTLKSVKIVTLPDSAHGVLKAGDPLAAVSAGDSVTADDLGTITFEPVANWNGSASFTYQVTDSSDAESAAAATVSITVNAVDDTVSVEAGSATEGSAVTFKVKLSATVGSNVVLDWVTGADDTTGARQATAGTDYTAVTDGSVTIAANATEGSFTVSTTADTATEGDETFKVTISVPTGTPLPAGLTMGTASAVGTIQDDDGATVSVEGGSAIEGSAVTFKAKLSAAVASDVVLGWTTGADDTEGASQATAGTDYTAVTDGSVMIAASQTEASFTVSTTADTATEGDETFKATITGTTLPAGVIIVTASAIGTIRDDDRPTASDIAKTVDEDTTLTFAATDFTGAFSDPDGHTLKSVKIVTLPDTAHGVLKAGNPLAAVSAGDSVTAANLGTLKFEPVANWNGSASFTYQVTDSSDTESAAAATVNITVSAVDDNPSAGDFSKTVNEDTTLTFAATDFTGAFSDADGHTLKSVKIVTLPNGTHGTLKVGAANATANQSVVAANLGTIKFEPAANWNGSASFTYKVTDSGDDESAAAATVSITVSAVDDAPSAGDFSKTVAEDTTLTFAATDFTGAFSDPDGHTLKSVKIVTLPTSTHGTLKVGAANATANQSVVAADLGTIKFEPVANWNGSASFTYKVTDSDDDESAAAGTVTITVSAVDDNPSASDFSKTVAEDTTLTFAATDFTGAFSDPDGHTLKSVKIVTLPDAAHGTLKVGAANATANQTVVAANLGTIKFEPVANWNGSASFTYKVTDSDDAESAAAGTVTITVSAVDDNPSAGDFSKTVDEDTTLTFAAADFTGAFSDPDDHTLKSVKIVTLPDAAHGTLKAGDPLAAVSAGDSVTAANLGTIKFEPVANWNGSASFTYKVTDSGDDESAAAATVSITVNAVDDTVSVEAGSATEGSAVTFKVKLTATVGSNVVLDWVTGADDTAGARQATAGTDYTAVTDGSLTITANATEGSFTVSTTADTATEGDETFKVTISVPTGTPLPAGLTMGTASAVGTIEDDDGVTVTVEGGSAIEGSAVTFKAKLSAAVGSDVVLGWTTGADDTTGAQQATAGTDYTAVTDGSVTITAGQTEASFTVSTTEDTATEGEETFKATITGTTLPAGVIIVTASAIGTIRDDDRPTASDIAKTVNEDTTLTFAATDFTGAFSDPDGHTLKSVKIVTLPNGAHGTLKAGNPLAALSAGDSVTAANLGTLKFEPVANWNGSASFTYQVTDSSDTESAAAATVNITVSAVDDNPSAGDFSKTVNEDTTLTFAATDFTGAFSDPDGHTLKSVKIVTLPTAAHGTLKVGTANATANQTVVAADLGTIKFEPVANWNGSTSFTYQVTDSDDAESAAAATVSITVSAVDDAPSASNFSKTVNEDTTLTFAATDFTGAFSDADGHTLKSVKIVTLPTAAHGTLKVGTANATANQTVVAADLGTIKFEPAANWNGSASFTYKVTDSGDDESAAAATVSITVSAVDDAPSAGDFSKTVAEDTMLTLAATDFTGAFSDPDGHTLKSVKIVTLPNGAHGTLKVGTANATANQSVVAADLGTIKFEPVANWNGSASFTYKVTDSDDDESAAAATVTITVSAVDDNPTASNFSKTVNEDTTLTFAATDFTGAFGDPDDHTLKSVKIVTLPDAAHGTLKVGTANATANQTVVAANLGTIKFEPVANWNGSASFTYKVTDSGDDESSAAATVSITVSAVDDAPTASGISKTVNEDTTLTFAATDFTGAFSDPDGHTLKSVKIVTLPTAAHGTLKVGTANATANQSVVAADLGTIKFEPVADWNGSASFTYKVTDSDDDESAAAATVTITVSAVDDAPSASNFSKTVDEDTTLTFAATDFTGAFSDPDGHTLKSVKIVTLPTAAHGTLKVGTANATANQTVVAANLGTIKFEPAANWNGSASFTYKVTDSDDDESSAAATVTITVGAADDAPSASNFSKTVAEDTTLTFAATDFKGAFSDPDDHTLKSVKIVTLPDSAHGTLKAGNPLAALSAGNSVTAANLGTITFEPVANWNGSASFTYKVTDSSDTESAAAATVTITVGAADDAPSASDFSKTVAEDTTLTFAAADFTGAFSDPDDHTLKSVKIVTLPDSAHGTLKAGDPLAAVSAGDSVAADDLGTITFEPVANWNGSASFTYQVTDSSDAESAAAATVTITVSAVDDAPTASDFSKTVAEDTTLTFAATDFTGAFSDPDDHTLKSVKIVTLPDAAHGTLKAGDPLAAVSAGDAVTADDLGTITFEPVANWNGSASFTYQVTDSSDTESAAAATVTITVGAVDDAPTASDFSKTVAEDTTLTFAATDFTGAFSDPDDHTLKSVKIVTLPDSAHGTLKAGDPLAALSVGNSVAAADLGTITFEPVADWNGSASFTYKVTDSDDAESATAATVGITVSAVDDAPTASGISKTVNEDTTLTFAAADFTGAFSDADGHTLKSVKIVTLPNSAHGTLKVGTADATAGQSVTAANLGTITFEPVADWNGTASFTYKVTDSDDAESTAAATVSISVTASVAPSPPPAPRAPAASSFSKSTGEDTMLTFAASDFTGAFSGPNGQGAQVGQDRHPARQRPRHPEGRHGGGGRRSDRAGRRPGHAHVRAGGELARHGELHLHGDRHLGPVDPGRDGNRQDHAGERPAGSGRRRRPHGGSWRGGDARRHRQQRCGGRPADLCLDADLGNGGDAAGRRHRDALLRRAGGTRRADLPAHGHRYRRPDRLRQRDGDRARTSLRASVARRWRR